MARQWTIDGLQEEALKHKTRSEFQRNSAAYNAAHKCNPLDQTKDGYFQSKGIAILHIGEFEWEEDKNACLLKCLAFLDANS